MACIRYASARLWLYSNAFYCRNYTGKTSIGQATLQANRLFSCARVLLCNKTNFHQHWMYTTHTIFKDIDSLSLCLIKIHTFPNRVFGIASTNRPKMLLTHFECSSCCYASLRYTILCCMSSVLVDLLIIISHKFDHQGRPVACLCRTGFRYFPVKTYRNICRMFIVCWRESFGVDKSFVFPYWLYHFILEIANSLDDTKFWLEIWIQS